ncbi:DUF3578 domain-containing protein [Pedobacter sp. UYP1]|uniref:MrcB family domain-containing protein n=1 Tax=Pedobacter sp. UYP1 TaxID=1756396 RepID=UPI00339B44E0
MKDLFQRIISQYSEESKKPLKNNQLAHFIKDELKNELKKIVNNDERYIVASSSGKGRWTATPWIAIFDIFITITAQEGFYPVFIFRDDMSGFYLTLNQGVTTIRQENKKETLNILKINAKKFRAQLGNISNNFSDLDIKLRNQETTKIGLSRDYEAGNIIAKFYSSTNLPSEDIFKQDISEILEIYKSLIFVHEEIETQEKDHENNNYQGDERKKYRQHKRIERNQTLIKKVKKAQGFICKACNLDFADKYGVLGKDFIEAHHLKPISQLTEEIVKLDAKKDFVVLCSNCHRMIHRTEDPSNLNAFKLLIKNQN